VYLVDDARHYKRIAMLHEIEQHWQLGPTIMPAAADLLGADHFAAGRLQGGMLNAEVLVEGADASVAVVMPNCLLWIEPGCSGCHVALPPLRVDSGRKRLELQTAVSRGRDGQFIPAGICWVVERAFARLSRYRRLNTIVERSKEHLIAFVEIAFISILSRRLKRLVVEELSA
jgi:hypothetical protein